MTVFTGRMPFLSPNKQCQSTEGKNITSTDLLTPSSPGGGGLPTLYLTTNSSHAVTLEDGCHAVKKRHRGSTTEEPTNSTVDWQTFDLHVHACTEHDRPRAPPAIDSTVMRNAPARSELMA